MFLTPCGLVYIVASASAFGEEDLELCARSKFDTRTVNLTYFATKNRSEPGRVPSVWLSGILVGRVSACSVADMLVVVAELIISSKNIS